MIIIIMNKSNDNVMCINININIINNNDINEMM